MLNGEMLETRHGGILSPEGCGLDPSYSYYVPSVCVRHSGGWICEGGCWSGVKTGGGEFDEAGNKGNRWG